MFYNYIIKSISKNWFYVGFTKDIDKRISQHNSGNVQSTKAYKPYNLIFVQLSNNRLETRNLEKYLKIRWNKESLLKLIDN